MVIERRLKLDFPKILLIIFAVIWTVLAIEPKYRFDWFLENIIVFLSLPLVILSYYKFRLSNFSYLAIFVMLTLDILGAYYTFGETPWGHWLSRIFGWQRNNYDRIAHFSYGLLIAPVAAEIFAKFTPVKNKFILYVAAFAVILSGGSIYEIMEYVVGIIVKPEAGLAFLGFQGDIWDTQKDMILQGLGAILGLTTWSMVRKKESNLTNS